MNALLRDALRVVAAVGLGGLALPLAAQTMYRCGSVYQDRPCANAQESRIVGRAQPADPAHARPALEADCAALGEAAQRIMWRREAGMTAAEQQSVHREPANLVADVYRRRGGSVQVRQGIEGDCMAERQRAAQAAAGPDVGALLDAVVRLRAAAASAPMPAAKASQR